MLITSLQLERTPRAISMACSGAPWLRSGLNVIDGCVAGDEIERDRVGRSVGASEGSEEGGRASREETREDETERGKNVG